MLRVRNHQNGFLGMKATLKDSSRVCAETPLESSLPLSPTIAAHAYALRAQAKFISASAAANSHSHSRIPDVVHSPEIYETLKENYPPKEFVSWTLPAVVQNNLTIISSPVPAKNSTASAGYKLRRFQPYATAKAKREKSPLRSPTLAPPSKT